jgi:ectoine hydroxylase-related dioxygenase (phytanoyl-CoA dioxygenase family)
MPVIAYVRDAYVADTAKKALRNLLEFGVAVVPGMLSQERAAATHSGLMGALEGVFPGFKRDDATTWRQLRQNGAKHAMLLQHHGLGWCQAAVDVRQDPEIATFFAALWAAREQFALKGQKTTTTMAKITKEELFVAPDGVSVYLKDKAEKLGGYHRDGHEWLHYDRAPSDPRWSVQGFVNLLPTSEQGAGFQCIVNSHRHQEEFVECSNGAEYVVDTEQRFRLLGNQYEANLYLDCGPHVCIQADVGDLVLWDSRLIHCGRAATRGATLLQRAVVYVSMQPKWMAKPGDLARKRDAHTKLRLTTHNAAEGVELFPAFPRAFNAEGIALKAAARPISVTPRLTALGRSLFGLL